MEALSLHQVIASLLPLVLLLIAILYTYNVKPWMRKRAHCNGFPEPSGARPLLGHLHLLATHVPRHRVLADMADIYGPIFTLKLGTRRAIIVSSWEEVKKFLGTNDQYFLSRPCTAASKYLGYNGAVFGLTSYGPFWRNMRRISTQELLSNARLDQLKPVLSSEANTWIKHLFSLCVNGPAKVDMSEWFARLVLNFLTQMLAGKTYHYDDKNDDREARRILGAIGEFMGLAGTLVVSDFIPCTEWMDLRGHIKKMKLVAKELDYFINDWLEEHVRNRRDGKVKDKDRDFIDIMLERVEQYDSSFLEHHSKENAIKATILNLLAGGVDTTSITLTWALSFLLNHAEVLKKAQNEIDDHVGNKRWVEESDIKDMVYTVAIVKETLRLHPAGPMTAPHVAIEDCYADGCHYVPKGTRLQVNIWKLHRNPRVWSDPEKFQPERFLTNARGQNFEYIPFSYGRRSCPGGSSGMQMSCLALARVLQGFNLAAPSNLVDMSEGLALTMPKATPLEVTLTPRLSNELYQK